MWAEAIERQRLQTTRPFALVPVLPGRDTWAREPGTGDRMSGWLTCIAIHDMWFLGQQRTHRARIADAHPDRGGSRTRMAQAGRRYRDFLREEVHYYRVFGLRPPREHRERRGRLRGMAWQVAPLPGKLKRCARDECGAVFRPSNSHDRYCGDRCRKSVQNAQAYERARRRLADGMQTVETMGTCKFCGERFAYMRPRGTRLRVFCHDEHRRSFYLRYWADRGRRMRGEVAS